MSGGSAFVPRLQRVGIQDQRVGLTEDRSTTGLKQTWTTRAPTRLELKVTADERAVKSRSLILISLEYKLNPMSSSSTFANFAAQSANKQGKTLRHGRDRPCLRLPIPDVGPSTGIRGRGTGIARGQ